MKIINLIEDSEHEGFLNEHGLSFYIETKKHRLLFDTGATDAFLQNAERLGIDLRLVDTVILSHGHYDHAGGLLAFSGLNPTASIYMKDTAGLAYYHIKENGERYIGINQALLDLPQVIVVKGDLKLDDELSLFSNITGRKYPAESNLELKKKTDNTFVQDTFDHEQCLVISQDGENYLLSGCAHNGILNILDRYSQLYQKSPKLTISGFHMIKKTEYTEEETAAIQETAKALKHINSIYYTGHCTGKAAYEIMKPILGEQLKELHSGICMNEIE